MSFKIGSKVRVLFFKEGEHDAPGDYIGDVGEVCSLTEASSGKERNVGVRFEDNYRYGFNKWDFKPEQLKLIEDAL